jgi:hypothetical protein
MLESRIASSADSRESTVLRTDAGVMTCVTKDVAVARPGRAIGVSDFIVVLLSVHDHDVMINAPIKKKNKFLTAVQITPNKKIYH